MTFEQQLFVAYFSTGGRCPKLPGVTVMSRTPEEIRAASHRRRNFEQENVLAMMRVDVGLSACDVRIAKQMESKVGVGSR